jgi:hypothetical protein
MTDKVHSTIFGSNVPKQDKKSKILPEIVTRKTRKVTGRVRNKTQVDGFQLVSQSSSPEIVIDKAASKVSEKKLIR